MLEPIFYPDTEFYLSHIARPWITGFLITPLMPIRCLLLATLLDDGALWRRLKTWATEMRKRKLAKLEKE